MISRQRRVAGRLITPSEKRGYHDLGTFALV